MTALPLKARGGLFVCKIAKAQPKEKDGNTEQEYKHEYFRTAPVHLKERRRNYAQDTDHGQKEKAYCFALRRRDALLEIKCPAA